MSKVVYRHWNRGHKLVMRISKFAVLTLFHLKRKELQLKQIFDGLPKKEEGSIHRITRLITRRHLNQYRKFSFISKSIFLGWSHKFYKGSDIQSEVSSVQFYRNYSLIFRYIFTTVKWNLSDMYFNW